MVAQQLLGLSISPVQLFIRESRKAQDLWSGSLLLSHFALQLVKTLREHEAEVVFPFLDFEPGQDYPQEPERPSVTNEVVARYRGSEQEAARVAKVAAQAAQLWWCETVAGAVKQRLLRLFEGSQLRHWEEQVRAQFRVVWAVVPAPDESQGNEKLAEAFAHLHTVLAAAKQCRCVSGYTGDARPKCTLSGDWEQMGPPFPSPNSDAVRSSVLFWRVTFPEKLLQIRPIDRDLYWAVTARLDLEGRERLCAVSLTKRLAPVLVLAPAFRGSDAGQHGDQWDPETVTSPLRFPSTTAIAWAEQKERLARLARDHPEVLTAPLKELRAAVEEVAKATREPRGRHWLVWYDGLLAGAAETLATALREFLELDGDWLNAGGRDWEQRSGHGLRRRAAAAWTRLDQAQKQLRRVVVAFGDERLDLNRTPPLALLRADADRLGKRLGEEVTGGGLVRARDLSRMLAKRALPQAVAAVEGPCRGKVIFAGGDELLALVPAVHALPAAAKVALAYSDRGREAGFPDLTCSVAVAVIASHRPLRLAIEELNKLLDQAKVLRRPAAWQQNEEIDRHALGLTIIPGSGNIKRGLVGLEVPCFDERRRGHCCRAIGDVLWPLAEVLGLPPRCGVRVSPKLYREWVQMFDPGRESHLPSEFLPRSGSEGIALSEFRRLAARHVELTRERNLDLPLASGDRHTVRGWLEAFLGTPPEAGREELTEQIVRALTWRVRSLLLSGSFRDEAPCEDAPWGNVAGLLLAAATLGTREVR